MELLTSLFNGTHNQAGFPNRHNHSYFLRSETFCKILFHLWKKPLSETVLTLLHTEVRKNFGYFTLDSGLLIKYQKYAELISLWNVSNLFKNWAGPWRVSGQGVWRQQISRVINHLINIYLISKWAFPEKSPREPAANDPSFRWHFYQFLTLRRSATKHPSLKR